MQSAASGTSPSGRCAQAVRCGHGAPPPSARNCGSIAHALMAQALVGEYRLLAVLTILGTGDCLVLPGTRPPAWNACQRSRPAPPPSRGTQGNPVSARPWLRAGAGRLSTADRGNE